MGDAGNWNFIKHFHYFPGTGGNKGECRGVRWQWICSKSDEELAIWRTGGKKIPSKWKSRFRQGRFFYVDFLSKYPSFTDSIIYLLRVHKALDLGLYLLTYFCLYILESHSSSRKKANHRIRVSGTMEIMYSNFLTL